MTGQRVSDEQLNEAIARALHHHEWTSGNFTHRDAEECWDEHDADERARWLGMGAAVAAAVEAIIVAATREAVAEEIQALAVDTTIGFDPDADLNNAFNRGVREAAGVARGVLVDGKEQQV